MRGNHMIVLDQVYEELVQVIKDAEEGLFQLKRARLLREADSVLNGCNHKSEDVKVEPLDPAHVEPEPLEEQSNLVGSKCRFRHSDGRWYNGQIVALDDSDSAKISFLTPISENMLMCKFFLQQRCRFGTNCRLSHGQVVFRDDGSCAKLGVDAISLSENAQVSDEEESDSVSEQFDSSDYEDEDSQGLGFLESSSQQRGIQTETVIFAKWENHTRGIASKMMANMGYQEGMGLGVSGQGMLDPMTVKVLPPKQSLDHALESHEGEETNKKQEKKRSRGGKRKREKKFAALARAAKEEEELEPDVFSLINNQLAMHHEALSGRSAKKQRGKGSGEGNKVDRRALVAYDDEVKDLRMRAEKLEEMVNRNRKEKVVYEAAMRKLNETRKALAEAESAHASASSAVVSREKEKRWLKF
ncbi:zinc finger ccch domain-containing protein 22 [Quercus suber]|uniref:Zinc finger ccch domain-containing protein 22 n=1 Tax=Quercus suber TaxID=58331 RepID=A0AAW0JQD6_QUESU